MALRQCLARSAAASRFALQSNVRAGSTAAPTPVKLSNTPGVCSASPVKEEYHFVHVNDPHHNSEEKLSHIAAKLLGSALVVSLLYVGNDEYKHLTSHHEFHAPAYRYLKIRTASYPWENDDCNLFDFKCHKMARLAKARAEK